MAAPPFPEVIDLSADYTGVVALLALISHAKKPKTMTRQKAIRIGR